ncbi:MAG: hypothetical protein PHI79_07105 [Sulfurovaceae bacterium]|nr:hypothetical protein [Sulfurovaceae bacterium]
MKKILHLNVKSQYYHDFLNGIKKEEYRLCNEYWRNRLEGKHYDEIHYKSGYPKNGSTDKISILPYNGYIKKTIRHEQFGDTEVEVYAIQLCWFNLWCENKKR